MGNKHSNQQQRLSVTEIVTAARAKGKANIHGVTPQISLLDAPTSRKKGTLRPKNAPPSAHHAPGPGSPTKIPVSPNYLSVLRERKTRMIEPTKKFSIVSRVSQFNSREILTNPISSSPPDSLFTPLLQPNAASPSPSELENEILRLHLYPNVYHNTGKQKRKVVRNYSEQALREEAIRRQLGRNPDLFTKVQMWSTWLNDASAAIRNPNSKADSNVKKVTASQSKTKMSDKATMTMSLPEFSQVTEKPRSITSKSGHSASRKSTSKNGGGRTSAAAAPSMKPRFVVRRRKRKSKARSKTGWAGSSAVHSALNDPKVCARVAFEDRNRQFLYREASRNHYAFHNYRNLQQNYFRDFPKF